VTWAEKFDEVPIIPARTIGALALAPVAISGAARPAAANLTR
jgi:hypothetical protein